MAYETIGGSGYASGGNGTFTQNGGTHIISESLYLCNSYNSNATYNLGSGALTAPTEFIGYHGTGTFTQTGGTNTVSGSLFLGYTYASGIGTYNLSGSGELSAANEYIGANDTGINPSKGTITQIGGTNTISGTLFSVIIFTVPGEPIISTAGCLRCRT